jgi:hypothetical protein
MPRAHPQPRSPQTGGTTNRTGRSAGTTPRSVERAEQGDFEDLRENGGAGDTVVRSSHNGDCESEVRHNDGKASIYWGVRPTNLWPGRSNGQVDKMYSPKLLRVEAAECRRGAIGKSARIERTLLALAERLESQATVLEARKSAELPRRQEIMRILPRS